jgi:hypothetical protein
VISAEAAAALAAQLELDVDEVGICHACLSVVSFPQRAGDERKTRRATNEFAPILWDEGLEAPVRAALDRAREAGVAGAEVAACDVEARGGRSVTVKGDRPKARRRPLGAIAGRPSTNGVQAMAAR